MRPSTYSSVLTATLLFAGCADSPVDTPPDVAEVLESKSQALASVTTLVNLVSTTETSTRTSPVVLVPGGNGQWSAAFRLLCNNCDHALSAFGFSSATAMFAPTYYSQDALYADNQLDPSLELVDLPLEPNMPQPAIQAAYRVIDASEPETPRYLVRLRARPELPYVTTCESLLRVAQGSLATIPINKNLLKHWALPATLPRIECASGSAKLPAPAPAPGTRSLGAFFTSSAIVDAWTATRPIPDLRAERYPYLVTRILGARQGFALDCGTSALDALASFGVASSELRTTPATDAELEATHFGARPALRCRGNDPDRILAITSADDTDGKVRFLFGGQRDVVEFLCPETEKFWKAQAGDAKVEIPLAALGNLNDFRDDLGGTALYQVGCRFNPLRYRMGKSIQFPGSFQCVSSPRNMSAHDPLQLESCDGAFAGPVLTRQAWLFDTASGVFSHETNDNRPMYMDHPLGSPAGTRLEIYPPSGQDSQRWSLSSGVLFNEGLCLDVSYGNIVETARLWFWPCHGGAAQRFFFPGDGTIRPVAAPNLCVDNDSDGSADGNRIWLYGCNGTQAQRWRFNGSALVNVRGCLDLDNAKGIVPGAVAQLWRCSGSSNQSFHYYGQIKNKQGHCLDVRDGLEAPDPAVRGGTCTGAWGQDLYYVP